MHIVLDPGAETYYIEKSAGGVWSNTMRISHTPDDWQLSGFPDLALDSDCSVHVVWAEGDTCLAGFAYIKNI